MALYRLIGSATTNESGVASVNYTGSGKGLTQIVASTDDSSHISDSSLLSETYEVTDAINIFKGTSNITNGSWSENNGVYTIITDGTTYALFTYSRNTYASGYIPIEVGNCVEFTLVGFEGTTIFRLDGSQNREMLTTTGSYSSYLTGNNKIRIENNGETLQTYIDGVLRHTSSNNTSETRRFRIRIENNQSIQIKDLCNYPI